MSSPTSEPRAERLISVTGTGRASAPPDVMRVQLVATALRPTVAAALAASEQVVSAIRAVLAAAGVAAEDASTLGLSINAEQVWNEKTGPRTTGYRSEHRLAVVLRDLAAAGRLLGEALTAGGDDLRLDGVGFEVEDDTDLREEVVDLRLDHGCVGPSLEVGNPWMIATSRSTARSRSSFTSTWSNQACCGNTV